MELFLNADAIEILAEITPATRHKVMDAAVHYCSTGEMPANLSVNVMAVFKMLIALSKASQSPRSQSQPEVSAPQRTKRLEDDREVVQKGLKTICSTFTLPKFMSDQERRDEQDLMIKVRDVIMNRYDSLRLY